MSPFQLVTVPGKDPVAERARDSATGLYPMLFGDAKDYERGREGMEEAPDASLVLKTSRRIDPPQAARRPPDF